MFFPVENESPLLAGHLKLIKTLFTCEGVDKKQLGKNPVYKVPDIRNQRYIGPHYNPFYKVPDIANQP